MPKRKHRSEPEPAVSPDKRYFLDPGSVSQHLYCSICQEVFTEPQRAPCGHSFCKLCIEEWLKRSKTCPSDRKPTAVKDLHHDFILENIIGDQKVACPFRPRGCEHICQLQQLSSHKKECKFNPDNLPEFLKEESTPVTKPMPKMQRLDDSDISESDSDEDKLPEPAFPSLKMRLFASDKQRQDLLCSMFKSSSNS